MQIRLCTNLINLPFELLNRTIFTGTDNTNGKAMTETNKLASNSPADKLVIRRPGIRVLRLPLNIIAKPSTPFSSTLLLVYGFAGLIILGALLLIFPFSSASGSFTSPLTAFFTATSAVCVTGLVVVDTGTYWSTFGHAVIFCLFQIGGLGFIIGATLMLFAIGGRFGLRDRLLISESMGVNQLSGLFGLVARVALFAFCAEIIGTLIFYFRWTQTGAEGASWWTAIFHSASVFNNCGLDLFGNFHSLAEFRNDPVTLIMTALLIVAGSTGYFVIADILKKRRFSRLALDSKIVIYTTLGLIIGGTLFFFIFEFSGPYTLGTLSIPHKIWGAVFQSITVRTAGFSTLDTGSLSQSAIFFSIFLMFVGGTTGSVAGGIKVNTLGTLIITVISLIRGKEHISAFGRQITHQTVHRAWTLALLYVTTASFIIMLLTITENFPLDKLIFETFSALGTVGASMGITSELSTCGRIIIILAMFIGRLAPLTFMAYLVRRYQPVELEYPHETIKLG
jgi:trk system potassium uptake protein